MNPRQIAKIHALCDARGIPKLPNAHRQRMLSIGELALKRRVDPIEMVAETLALHFDTFEPPANPTPMGPVETVINTPLVKRRKVVTP